MTIIQRIHDIHCSSSIGLTIKFIEMLNAFFQKIFQHREHAAAARPRRRLEAGLASGLAKIELKFIPVAVALRTPGKIIVK